MPFNPDESLLEASIRGDARQAREAIAAGANIDVQCPVTLAPACLESKERLTGTAAAQPNQSTPLHLAVFNCNEEVAAVLVNAGCQKKLLDKALSPLQHTVGLLRSAVLTVCPLPV